MRNLESCELTFCKRLLVLIETVPFTCVNVTALSICTVDLDENKAPIRLCEALVKIHNTDSAANNKGIKGK